MSKFIGVATHLLLRSVSTVWLPVQRPGLEAPKRLPSFPHKGEVCYEA